MSGLFISIEGGEGAGKSTQIRRLCDAINLTKRTCLMTREPGGTESAEAIRNLLLTGSADKWHPVTETLLFQAARVEHVSRIIAPALSHNKVVLCDRFVDSTIVYQGISKGLGVEYIQQLHQLTVGNLIPHITILLDIDPVIGLARTKGRDTDETRFEDMALAFHQAVRKGFLALATANPYRYVVVDASLPPDNVHRIICEAVLPHL